MSPPPSQPPPSKRTRVGLSVWISLLGVFVSNMTLTILTIALPQIARDLDSDRGVTNWITLGPMLITALLTPLAGRAADTLGRKAIWISGLMLATMGMVASALSPTLPWLLAARLLTGVGTALMIPAGLALATAEFPPEERATPVGYWTTTVAISPMLGILVGGFALDHVSWRWLFWGQVALAGFPLAAAFIWFKEQRVQVQGRFDWAGSFTVGLAALAVMVCLTLLPRRGALDPWVLGCLALTIMAAALSVSIERRADNPVVPPALVADPQVAWCIVARLSMNFTYMGAFMVLPYLLQEVWGWNTSDTSLTLLWRPFSMGATGMVVGRIAQRFGAPVLVLVGSVAILGASSLFITLNADPAPAPLLCALVLAGVGLGLASPGTAAVVTGRVPVQTLGTASALMTLTATISNTLGMAVLFAVVELAGGVRAPSAYRVSFVAGAVVVLGSIIAGLRVLSHDRAERLASRPV